MVNDTRNRSRIVLYVNSTPNEWKVKQVNGTPNGLLDAKQVNGTPKVNGRHN